MSQSTSSRILAIHHAQITIPKGEEEAAKNFYCIFLGLKEIPKPDSLHGRRGFWMELGSLQIHVGTEDGFDRNQTKAHLAYLVENLEQWRQRLAEQHIETFDGPVVPGYTRFEFRDPFGNRVEFIERT